MTGSTGIVGFGLGGGSALGFAAAGASSVVSLSSLASAESVAFLLEFGAAPGAVAGLSGGALVLAPSSGVEGSVDPVAFVGPGFPAGEEPGAAALFPLADGVAAGDCAAGCGSGVIDGVVDEFAGAVVAVDPGEDAGDSAVPGCSCVIAGFFAGGLSHANPWFFQRK